MDICNLSHDAETLHQMDSKPFVLPHSFKGRKQCENPGKLDMDWTQSSLSEPVIVARKAAETQRHEVTWEMTQRVKSQS